MRLESHQVRVLKDRSHKQLGIWDVLYILVYVYEYACLRKKEREREMLVCDALTRNGTRVNKRAQRRLVYLGQSLRDNGICERMERWK